MLIHGEEMGKEKIQRCKILKYNEDFANTD